MPSIKSGTCLKELDRNSSLLKKTKREKIKERASEKESNTERKKDNQTPCESSQFGP